MEPPAAASPNLILPQMCIVKRSVKLLNLDFGFALTPWPTAHQTYYVLGVLFRGVLPHSAEFKQHLCSPFNKLLACSRAGPIALPVQQQSCQRHLDEIALYLGFTPESLLQICRHWQAVSAGANPSNKLPSISGSREAAPAFPFFTPRPCVCETLSLQLKRAPDIYTYRSMNNFLHKPSSPPFGTHSFTSKSR
jgi:hypothetical protein